MELVSIKDAPLEIKREILRELGYDTDGKFVLGPTGQKFTDKYTGEAIKLENMLILPGSTVILDNNPLSITEYFEEENGSD